MTKLYMHLLHATLFSYHHQQVTLNSHHLFWRSSSLCIRMYCALRAALPALVSAVGLIVIARQCVCHNDTFKQTLNSCKECGEKRAGFGKLVTNPYPASTTRMARAKGQRQEKRRNNLWQVIIYLWQAAAKQIAVDAALSAVLSEVDGIRTLK